MNAMPAGPSPDPSGGGGGGFDDGGDLSAQHAGWIVKDTASRLLGLAYNRTHTGNPQRLCVHRRQRRAERVAAKRRKEASAAREGEMVSLDEFPELEELIKVSGIAAPAPARGRVRSGLGGVRRFDFHGSRYEECAVCFLRPTFRYRDLKPPLSTAAAGPRRRRTWRRRRAEMPNVGVWRRCDRRQTRRRGDRA